MKKPKDFREQWAIDNGYKDWEESLQYNMLFPENITGIMDAICSLYAIYVIDYV